MHEGCGSGWRDDSFGPASRRLEWLNGTLWPRQIRLTVHHAVRFSHGHGGANEGACSEWRRQTTVRRDRQSQRSGVGAQGIIRCDGPRDQVRSLWRHTVDPAYKGDFEAALRAIRARTIILPVDTDRYFPPVDAQEEARHIPNAKCLVIESELCALFRLIH